MELNKFSEMKMNKQTGFVMLLQQEVLLSLKERII